MSRHIVTGLDIGTASIRVVVCEYKKGNKIPKILALIKKPSRGLRRGYILQFDEVVENIKHIINEAEREAGVKIKRAFVGLGGVTLESKVSDGNITPSRADSEITTFDINRAIEQSELNLPDIKNKTIVHRIPLGFKLDGKKILGRPEGLKGSRLDARTLFILYSSQHLNELINAVETAGVHVEDIVASPLASSFATLTKLQKTAGCVLANIGSQTTSIVIFEENIPVSLQVFPFGSNDITNDIAIGLQIAIEDAERTKVGERISETPRKKLDEIIQARLSDIFELIENHLKKLGSNGLLPAGIIITGGGSGISEIEDLAKKYFRLPAKISADAINLSSRNQIRDSAWSVAYGLCLFGADAEAEESLGIRVARHTKLQFIRWLKELWP